MNEEFVVIGNPGMRKIMELEKFLSDLKIWAKSESSIVGVLLVGSYARKEASPNSDVDVVILTSEKHKLLSDTSWLKKFGKIRKFSVEEYGVCTSLRTFYYENFEVEFGLVSPEWANDSPIDEGTRAVVKGGARLIWEQSDEFTSLLSALKMEP